MGTALLAGRSRSQGSMERCCPALHTCCLPKPKAFHPIEGPSSDRRQTRWLRRWSSSRPALAPIGLMWRHAGQLAGRTSIEFRPTRCFGRRTFYLLWTEGRVSGSQLCSDWTETSLLIVTSLFCAPTSSLEQLSTSLRLLWARFSFKEPNRERVGKHQSPKRTFGGSV